LSAADHAEVEERATAPEGVCLSAGSNVRAVPTSSADCGMTLPALPPFNAPTVAYRRMYPHTMNHVQETLFAVKAARAVVREANVNAELEPLMGSEDFAFMLEERPGNIMLIGNGDTAGVHDPRYDFNDAAIPCGIAYFRSLIESGMPL
jgi:metal-dependent amidase/aminoacylase/carboxypeptidase family protein